MPASGLVGTCIGGGGGEKGERQGSPVELEEECGGVKVSTGPGRSGVKAQLIILVYSY